MYTIRPRGLSAKQSLTMCELLGISSNRLATVNLSLMKLAEHGGLSGPHRDGWGVGYYEGTDIRLIKDAEAAASSDLVRFIERHDLRSNIVVAHVRKASLGERAYRNTQPFVRELSGRMHLFAHNGLLVSFDGGNRTKPKRYHPVGETDSEQAFCVLLDRMSDLWTEPGQIPPIQSRLSLVSSFASELRAFGPANFLYSDGDALFAHGDRRKSLVTEKVEAPGLVYLQRTCRRGEHGFVASGVSIDGIEQLITIVASVPLTDAPWQALGEGEVLVVSGGRIAMRQLGTEAFHA
jgi:glutamine amidotransferase